MTNDITHIDILLNKFFPSSLITLKSMIDLALNSLTLQIKLRIIKAKVKRVLKRLLRGKVLGLNGILNEVLILLTLDISINLT
jgi:hypothetical protein